MELETDFEDIEDDVQETRTPLLADQAAAATQNANLYKTTDMDPKTTGVHRAPNSFIVQHDVEDDEYDWPPKIEVDYDSDDSNDDDNESYGPPYSRNAATSGTK